MRPLGLHEKRTACGKLGSSRRLGARRGVRRNGSASVAFNWMPPDGMVWHGMVEVCEGAPVAMGGWVLTHSFGFHNLTACMAWYHAKNFKAQIKLAPNTGRMRLCPRQQQSNGMVCTLQKFLCVRTKPPKVLQINNKIKMKYKCFHCHSTSKNPCIQTRKTFVTKSPFGDSRPNAPDP